ncbi:hypothetical protein BDW62DRAFT_164941 [Aspergillus aurantiobrunneus]
MPEKRRSGDLTVPDITEDAAERKRVLNVLAQRRYRKRKKDRLQTLQSQVEKQGDKQGERSAEVKQKSLADSVQPSLPDGMENMAFESLNLPEPLPDTIVCPGFLSLLSTPGPSQTSSRQISTNNDPFAYPSPPALPFLPGTGPCEDQLFDLPTNDAYNLSDQLQISESSTFTFPDDHTIEIPSLKLLNAAMKVALRLNVAHILWDISAVSPFYTAVVRDSHSSLTGGPSQPSLTPPSSVSSLPSQSQSPPSNPIPQDAKLPPHLRPTQTQLLFPHHPVFDILPWPSTRDKLIQIFNLPPSLRPKSAQDPIGMLQLVYDMEDDSGEGIRIRGADVFEPGSWEIGQVVFERWWWAFEGNLVERCDRSRRERGEEGLVLG